MIHIEIPFNKTSFLRNEALKLKLVTRQRVTNTGIYLVAGLVLIALNQNSCEDTVSFVLSWLALCLGLMSLCRLIVVRLRHSRSVKALANKFEAEQMDCEYHFDENGMAYRDKEKAFNCQWDVVKGFSLSKTHLIFHVLSKESCDIIIDRLHFTEVQFCELDDYLGKLKQVLL